MPNGACPSSLSLTSLQRDDDDEEAARARERVLCAGDECVCVCVAASSGCAACMHSVCVPGSLSLSLPAVYAAHHQQCCVCYKAEYERVCTLLR